MLNKIHGDSDKNVIINNLYCVKNNIHVLNNIYTAISNKTSQWT